MNNDRQDSQNLEQRASLPEILRAEWAKDQVMQLFADLAEGATVQQVQLKSAATDGSVPLGIAAAAFSADEAQAIQVRYSFEGELWCDTIMPGFPTTQIIRSRIPHAG